LSSVKRGFKSARKKSGDSATAVGREEGSKSKTGRSFRLGIDTGGTFTDLTLYSEAGGRVWELKVPSTPQDPSEAIVAGIRQIAALAEIAVSEIDYFAHGTTVATNTLIELDGAKCALITTKGFRDLLEIGRQKRPHLYDFYADKPTTLIPRRLRLEVSERLLSDGSMLRPLNREELNGVLNQVLGEGVESVAICFLYSYLDDKHERCAKEALLRLKPDLYVYTSSEVLPEFREFERLSTTVLCAYLGPVVGQYCELLAQRAKNIGMPGQVYVMQSSGGIMSASAVKDKPIETALSGPAGGVIAAAWMSGKLNNQNFITLDMGGTSADVCLISQGVPAFSTERSLAGYPVKVPMLDINTIGAGGGSIAWVDEGGALKVGPSSAGAAPGAACYGKGGTMPTVTDANLLLGRIASDDFLGGRMPIHPELANEAITKHIGQPLGMNSQEAARGIITLVNDNMVRAVRTVSVEKGYDPREFTLLAFGGAGPLHAVDVARELGMREVLVPGSPGTFSSLGLLIADFRSDFVRTRILPGVTDSCTTVNEILSELSENAMEWLGSEKIPRADMRLQASIDIRYRKQNYEQRVDLASRRLNAAGLRELLEAFHSGHARQHGYSLPDVPIEFVSYRITAAGILPKAEFVKTRGEKMHSQVVPAKRRKVYAQRGARSLDCPVYLLEDLNCQTVIEGPAIVEHSGSTTWLPPQSRAQMDEFGNLRIRTSTGGGE
jgi:N-methylhydantoinase A